jgi:hypothetical protein
LLAASQSSLGCSLKEVLEMKGTFFICALLVVGLRVGPVAFAHHGNTDYDSTKETVLKGTIIAFEFINPHAEIVLEVKNDKGVPEKWSLELSSPNSLRRTGWTRNTVKPGTEVTAFGNPNRSGSKNLYLLKLKMPDGTEIRAGATQ